MPTLRFIVVRLRRGWALGNDGCSLVRDGQPTAVDLPAGARLTLALALPPPEGGAPTTAAEAEIARYLHLHLPAEADLAAALQRVAAWPGVGRVTLPPEATVK
jgi:hypothetical protein